jgi:Flp pilus assembly protein TadB
VRYVPKSASESKTELLTTRVTPRIKSIVVQIAQREGLDVSEWLRNLVVSELRKRGEFQKSLKQE